MITYMLKSFLDSAKKGGYTKPVKFVTPSGKEVKNYIHAKGDILTVEFHSVWAILKTKLLSGDGFSDAFAKGQVSVSGTELPLAEAYILSGHVRGIERPTFLRSVKIWIMEHVLRLFHTSNKTYKVARENARFHYNKPEEFWRPILGETLGYSENYLITGKESLDEGQRQKFEYIAKCLHLKPGMHVVEVGSGWGYLSLYMAKEYGCYVTNYGLVPEQNKVMERRIKEWGVEDKVKIVVKDHRELLHEKEKYDRYVSVGVYEHAGNGFQEEWLRSISTCLKEGGIGFISSSGHQYENVNSYFINMHMWPGTDLAPLNKVVYWMARHRLNIINIENLWYHYQSALRQWALNFHKHWKEIQAQDPEKYTDTFMRSWQIYLEGCTAMWEENTWNAQLWYITFSKGKHKDYYPLTRHFLYTDAKKMSEQKER